MMTCRHWSMLVRPQLTKEMMRCRHWSVLVWPQLTAAADEGDDEMPPLEYAGVAGADEGDDEMPPLECVGVAAADKGDDEMPPLEYVGAAAADEGDDEMPPLEYAGVAGADEGDDEMPPLEYVGAAAADEGDDEMPPLEYVGAATADEGDDEMPPLEYVGADALAASAVTDPQVADDDDDDMPPLEYVGAPQHEIAHERGQQLVTVADGNDDDMPPLEYVGTEAKSAVSFKEGEKVVLKGLSKADLNGKTGTVQSFVNATKGRLPVKLDASGQRLAVKPDNLVKAVIEEHGLESDEDDMPPLEYVGAAATVASKSMAPVDAGDGKDDADDDMPPLEYVGVTKLANGASHQDEARELPRLEEHASLASNGTGHATGRELRGPDKVLRPGTDDSTSARTTFREGDTVILKGLQKSDLNGQRGIVEKSVSKAINTLNVKLDKSGQCMSLPPENLHKIWLRGASAGAMPPLQYVGSQVMPTKQALGDMVVLCNMKLASLNGEKAKITSLETNDTARLQVQLLRSGQKLMVGQENVQRTMAKVANRDLGPASAQDHTLKSDKANEADAILEQMRCAMQSTFIADVDGAIEAAEGSQVTWGELLVKKKQVMKKLRAKQKKMQEDGTEKANAIMQAAPVNSAIARWCEELQLPMDLVERLADEDVTDPQELTGVGEEELSSLTVGWKLGPKGRFMKAVQRMKAVERAELGSMVGSTC
eukprot:TRINITY_DN3661_c0_g1_i3.p1 TRINITY_DN3661_c0_g1~~TRINITY_DN3661_c0_g1_i3.p1  ORF type:complete len:710 (-),score=202.07 TRINITY_DN3661_c0_g1_i3:449-2578(-)